MSADPRSPEPRAPATVLLVEDESLVRRLAKRVLEDAGQRVLEAADGAAGLTLLAAHAGPLDLLVTDLVMPGPGVRELVRRVRALHPGVRVLLASGHARTAELEPLLEAAGARFLAKPFTPDELLAAVRGALAPGAASPLERRRAP